VSLGTWALAFGPFESDPWPFEKVCALAAADGYDGVEINGFRPHPHDEDLTTDRSCRQISVLLDDHGLAASGYAPDFSEHPPAEDPAGYLRRIDSAVAFCARLGIDMLRTDTVSPPAILAPDDRRRKVDRLVSTWRTAAERCRRSGVTLLWEFEPGFWLNRPSDTVEVVAAVDHPGFRVLFDTSHAFTSAVAGARHGAEPELLPGGTAEYARQLGEWIGHVHITDSDGTLHDGVTSNHLPLGTGDVEFLRTLEAASPSVVDLPWWTVDLCFCAEAAEAAGPAVPFVRDLIQQMTHAHGRSARPAPQERPVES
jgi:sugar phosphate isomerase/epimerase